MELISMLIKEFEFTFLILQFGAVLELLHWFVEDSSNRIPSNWKLHGTHHHWTWFCCSHAFSRMSGPFQWSNLNPVYEPAQIASQQILSWKYFLTFFG
jgi:hypothetical protein